MTALSRPLELPCGAVLKNRLIKSAMSDSLGDGAGNATETQARLYERWAEGGAAMSLVGEVQGDSRYPEKPGNLVLAPDSDLHLLQTLARRGAANGAHLWTQLGHAGALSHAPISRPKGPSALDVAGLRCEEMSPDDIRRLPDMYAAAAAIAKNAGFGGVQIHAGHGFLLSQFLSPLFNRRTDAYGGAIKNRFRVVGEIMEAVRHSVGASFPVGIKINCTDKLQGGLTDEDAMEAVRMLGQTSADLLDISGGTYFPGAASSSDGVSASGPYFADFARRAKEIVSAPIMATGGFVAREEAENAVENGCADAAGIARAMALNPNLANVWLDGGDTPAFPVFDSPPRGGITAWYSMLLTALGENGENQFNMTPAEALAEYESRDAKRCEKWRARFSQTPSE